MRVGEFGFWQQSLGGPGPRRPPLPGSLEADVAIVGAGFTGLWTAYYLKRAEPSLQIVVLERAFAGYGASGRNGGWVMGACEGAPERYARRGGRELVLALRRELFATVDEIAAAVEREGIEADFHRGGALTVALGDAEVERLRAHVEHARAWGAGEGDLRLLGADELSTRVRVAGARGASFTPHVARVHPAKLVRGLASAAERLGVTIHESTAVREIRPRTVLTEHGEVHARWVVRATEGYTASLRGLGRLLAPVNSSMIVTEPLSERAWGEIGWSDCEALGDEANVYVYLQRTADGRIAIGGRGVPYRFGSRADDAGETGAATAAALEAKLHAMFPAIAGARIDHAWSGVLGVPRDWCVSVDADHGTGLAWAGGYSGEGVAATNLAARTLRDLILGERTPLVTLPWVGHRPARWEPEPLRYAAIRGTYALYRRADAIERRSGRPSLLARAVDAASGRH